MVATKWSHHGQHQLTATTATQNLHRKDKVWKPQTHGNHLGRPGPSSVVYQPGYPNKVSECAASAIKLAEAAGYVGFLTPSLQVKAPLKAGDKIYKTFMA